MYVLYRLFELLEYQAPSRSKHNIRKKDGEFYAPGN